MEPAAMSRSAAMREWDATHPEATTEERDHIEVFFDRVLLRRDVVLVYRNTALFDPDKGMVKLISYGSDHALIRRRLFEHPPRTMPDTPGESNWKYELIGIVDGQAAPS